jgi:amino acid adenylation domain-containing protein
VLLAAWQIVLHKFTGASAFFTGVAMERPPRPELCDAIGSFMKYLPLSTNIEGNSRFIEVVQQVQRSLEVAQYDQLFFNWEPFGARDTLQNRHLFPVVFRSVQLPVLNAAESPAWEIEFQRECTELFELGLTAVTSADDWRFEFTWERFHFVRQDIELLADSYFALLYDVARASDHKIIDLNLSAPGSAVSLMRSSPVYENELQLVHELIEDHARRAPEKPAVNCGDQQITYGELDSRASFLAHALEKAGARPDSVVALLAERSLDFIVGILGILKAGAAWLPIEPGTPAERIEYMIRQAQAVAVLTQADIALSIEHGALPVVYINDAASGTVPPRNRKSIDPGQLAYVMFTSGSTGRPKGVGVQHGHIAAYAKALRERVGLDCGINAALVSTLAADLGLTALLAALTSGGCLHVIPSQQALDADALAGYFLQHPVDLVKIVPAHLEALCRSFSESVHLSWRYLLIGGEPLTWSLIKSVHRWAPGCAIFNHYGPTETTVGVFCGQVKQEADPFLGSTVPIGRPLSGTSAYLLDEQLQPVPAWVAGELYIGGCSVSRGYVGNGDLTADRFVPDPFHSKPGSRMYRTGDLARYRSDGVVEFLGRRDGQIKIRGYRVELAEIEAALCLHPQVRNAAVVVSEQPSTGKMLAAWAAVGSAEVKPDDLRNFMQQKLPHYMVPGIFMCVDRLKLNANGKVDRQALPALTSQPEPAEFCEPLDAVEENLVAVWQKVLGKERISAEDNYFALGGDSLRVIHLVHEARRYGINITATEVLRYQTIRRLRQALLAKLPLDLPADDVLHAALPAPELTSSLPPGIVDSYPVTGMQEFVLKNYAESKGSQGIFHIQDCYYVEDKTLSPDALEAAFRVVVERHPGLRTFFDLAAPEPTQQVCGDLSWTMVRTDISDLADSAQDEHIAEALRLDRASLFDAGDRKTPLFRMIFFLRSRDTFTLIFSFHHAIMDGWGHRVLLNQFLAAYLSIKAGVNPDLGQPDPSCREFALLQQAVRRSPEASAFWKNYLSPVQSANLAAREADSRQCPDDASFNQLIEAAEADALVRVAREHAISMQALLLSAWLQTLRGSGNECVVAGVIFNGRSEYLSDPLSAVGLFWNIVPVVSRAPLPLLEHAAAVHKDLIEIEPYSAYPLQQLLDDRGGQEIFSSVFRYLNFWNTSDMPEQSGLRFLDVTGLDRYPFPLTCTAVINSVDKGGLIHVQYDPAVVSDNHAQLALEQYASLLRQIAAEASG